MKREHLWVVCLACLLAWALPGCLVPDRGDDDARDDDDTGSDDDDMTPSDDDDDATEEPCPPDSYEPNDSQEAAALLAPGLYPDLRQCSEPDWYQVAVGAGDEVSVTLAFDHAEGDIDLDVRTDTDKLGDSDSTGDEESVTVTAPSDGALFVRVYLYEDTGSEPGNPYTLTLTVDSPCVADALEPNDSLASAVAWPSGSETLTVCPGSSDYYLVPAFQLDSNGEPTHPQHLSVHFSASEGDLNLELLGENGVVIEVGTGSSDSEWVNHELKSGAVAVHVSLAEDLGAPGIEYSTNISN
jgi:hypothetical protein